MVNQVANKVTKVTVVIAVKTLFLFELLEKFEIEYCLNFVLLIGIKKGQ